MSSFHASGVALSDSSLQVDIHIDKGDFFLHMEQIQFNNSGTTWRKIAFFSINFLTATLNSFFVLFWSNFLFKELHSK